MDDVIIIGAGQAGLAIGRELQKSGLAIRILEGGNKAGGSWPQYYDSLRLFSPVEYSSLPGLDFPGRRGTYPGKEEVAAYLRQYAQHFGLPITTNQTVVSATVDALGRFQVQAKDGSIYRAQALVVATGTFRSPHRPNFPGQEGYEGRVLHACEYRNPSEFKRKQVIVVGAANSAVQISVELQSHASVTLASREPIRFLPQRILGQDIHFWFKTLGVDRSTRVSDQSSPVLDDGRYRRALRKDAPSSRPIFQSFTPTGVRWADGSEQNADAVILATGYRPSIPFLDRRTVVGPDGKIRHADGASLAIDRLYFVGQPGLRSFQSATLRGVGVDAAVLAPRILTDLERVSARPRLGLPNRAARAPSQPGPLPSFQRLPR